MEFHYTPLEDQLLQVSYHFIWRANEETFYKSFGVPLVCILGLSSQPWDLLCCGMFLEETW